MAHFGGGTEQTIFLAGNALVVSIHVVTVVTLLAFCERRTGTNLTKILIVVGTTQVAGNSFFIRTQRTVSDGKLRFQKTLVIEINFFFV